MRSDLHFQVSLGQLLGEGMFGRTFLGMWRGGDVAVKTVRVGKESEASSFLREVASLAAIRHPNVMQFFGEAFFPPLCTMNESAAELSNNSLPSRLADNSRWIEMFEECCRIQYMRRHG